MDCSDAKSPIKPEKLFSVVIPVYKVEAYLEACVRSVLGQTYGKMEIILVDDGSPDRCPEMCDRFAEADERVRVIHKKNGGLSDARNCGIEAASGDYLVFVDSDDLLTPDALERISGCLLGGEDVLITEMVRSPEPEKEPAREGLFSRPATAGKPDAIRCVFSQKTHRWASVQYIVRREFILRSGLRFDVGFLHEDISWTARLFATAESFSYFTGTWYLCRTREASITTTVSPKRSLDATALISGELKSPVYAKLDEAERLLIYRALVSSQFTHISFTGAYPREAVRKIADMIDQTPEYVRYCNEGKYKIFFIFARCFGTYRAIRLAGGLYSVIRKQKRP